MLEFYKNKKIFITGHTGFKGSWLSKVLINLGANVTGYSLETNKKFSIFSVLRLEEEMNSIIGDIRDLESLKKAMLKCNPDIVIHMAAQPLVLESYENPVYTYETNVIGTVNVLECIRKCENVKSVLNVTTDKVYKNKEWEWGYREYEELDGYDPYSNSKSCSELITNSYRRSFFSDRNIAISSVRSGNVIGGGDISPNRIIPDCIRSIQTKKEMIIRNPHSVRPYQHVLDAIVAYLLIIKKQYINKELQGAYNVGPNENNCISTEDLVKLFFNCWDEKITCNSNGVKGKHEANFLKLDCEKIKKYIEWNPIWSIEDSIKKTVEWTKVLFDNERDIVVETNKQINCYFDSMKYNSL
ncbi:CDP-glucose 4,6-dehydratase [Clostridium butyricum]|uniref:CDP-glucose 4,6-dehydratase n=1 Tax=Clostridium butyricum TaxID=1492 RepID=UPI002107FCEA|nr:CDP-glucose 4,6-dehydratase [Clostridium butyricum]MCQ2014182.1 CDP-glucose 4,6-dehydratase [Clostridium butyricum]MCQ2026272.1 CDP-glucose 4,6-dehydratase [Clostridium butyricum]